MTAPRPPPERPQIADGRTLALMASLAACIAWVYGRTLSVPELFDDDASISLNPTIRHFSTALFPPSFATVGGRPVLNLSLALSHALSGNAVWGYHLVNIAVHVLAAWTLFAIAARTLAGRAEPRARQMGFLIALIWALHPLQTESVTYLIQRAESLMGLFFLLAIYGFIRSAAPRARAPGAWAAASVACCLLGMGTKEVMVAAPAVILFYDRAFVSASFSGALRGRKAYYGALAATWLALPPLVWSTHGRGGTAGFGSGVAAWRYLLAQGVEIVRYLKLSLWPHPLVFDYGTALPALGAGLVLCCVLVAALLAAAAWACASRPPAGFLGAAFFAVLAPSSSIVPVASEPAAEHRMYLALAPIAALAVLALGRWAGRALLPIGLTLAAVLGWMSFERNRAYASELSLWSDTAQKRPMSVRAHSNLGNALDASGQTGAALAQYEEALKLDPGSAEVHSNLGNIYSKLTGRRSDAIVQYEESIRLKPDYEPAHKNLGNALLDAGHPQEAAAQEEEALRLRPGDAEARSNLAGALAAVPGRTDEAILQAREALALDPGLAQAHANLAAALLRVPGRLSEAVSEAREAVRLSPSDARARIALGSALMQEPGQADGAIEQFREAVRLDPSYAGAHNNLGNALGSQHHEAEAAAEIREALRLDPASAEAHNNLGVVLTRGGGSPDDAIAEYREALRLKPDYVSAHSNLGSALATAGRSEEAVGEFREAVRLSPDSAGIRFNLAIALIRAGAPKAAAGELREILRRQPGFTAASQLLASLEGAGP